MKINKSYDIHNKHATFGASCNANGHSYAVKGKIHARHVEKKVNRAFKEFKKCVEKGETPSQIKKHMEKKVSHCHVKVKQGREGQADILMNPHFNIFNKRSK